MSSPVLLRKGNCRKSNQVKEIFNYMRDNDHNYYPNEKTHTMKKFLGKIRLQRDMHTDEFEAEPQKSQPFNCKSLNNKGVC